MIAELYAVEFSVSRCPSTKQVMGRLHYRSKFEQTPAFISLRTYIDIVLEGRHEKNQRTKTIWFTADISTMRFLFAQYPNRCEWRNRLTQAYIDWIYGLE